MRLFFINNIVTIDWRFKFSISCAALHSTVHWHWLNVFIIESTNSIFNFFYCLLLGILTISASLYMIGLLHGIFWLKEPKPHTENVKKKAMIIDIFNYQNIVDPFKLLFTSSPGNNRLVIILVMFLIFIITGICQGKEIFLN